MASLFKWQAYVATLLIQKNLASNLARFFLFPQGKVIAHMGNFLAYLNL